jgi:murein L,D-transpeptidase YafK
MGCNLSEELNASIKTLETPVEERLASVELEKAQPLFMRIFKEEKELELWIQNKSGSFSLFHTYPVCYYSGSIGPKTKQGDKQAPEGFYFVGKNALNPHSSYYKSFNLGYPNAYDRAQGYTGDFLMVHGKCVSVGCYAMTDKQIDEIYSLAEAALDGGQPFFRVHIFPFRMTEANMKKHEGSEWMDFWLMLKEGYDSFEESKIPPNVEVVGGKYIFNN